MCSDTLLFLIHQKMTFYETLSNQNIFVAYSRSSVKIATELERLYTWHKQLYMFINNNGNYYPCMQLHVTYSICNYNVLLLPMIIYADVQTIFNGMLFLSFQTSMITRCVCGTVRGGSWPWDTL